MATLTQIAKWGNSLALRLPKSVALEAEVDEGDTVSVSVKTGAIVIRPSRPKYSLERLVGKITPRNRQGDSDWGTPVGHEVWEGLSIRSPVAFWRQDLRGCSRGSLKNLDWEARRVVFGAKAPDEIIADVRERLRVLLGS